MGPRKSARSGALGLLKRSGQLAHPLGEQSPGSQKLRAEDQLAQRRDRRVRLPLDVEATAQRVHRQRIGEGEAGGDAPPTQHFTRRVNLHRCNLQWHGPSHQELAPPGKLPNCRFEDESWVSAKRPKPAFRPFRKNWRQPTLAEAIQPLPSAMLCLTAVFGMGTGRTTASWPPRKNKKINFHPRRQCQRRSIVL